MSCAHARDTGCHAHRRAEDVHGTAGGAGGGRAGRGVLPAGIYVRYASSSNIRTQRWGLLLSGSVTQASVQCAGVRHKQYAQSRPPVLVLSLAPGPAWHTPRGSAQSMPCYCSGKACQCLRLRAHALGTRLPDAAPHASAGLRRRRRPSRPQASTATRNHQGVAHRRAHRPMCWRGRAERRPARTRHRTPPRARGPCCARYYALALALALTPAQLGALSAARGLTQALASPVAGLLGDAWHRGRIIAAGTLAWAGASLAFGLCVNYPQARGPQARRSRAWPLRGARLRSQPRPQAAGAGVRGAVRRGPRARDAVRDGHRG